MAVNSRQARRTMLFIKKSTTFILVGCIKSISRSNTADIYVEDCRANKKKRSQAPTEGVDRKVSLNGIYRDFTAGDIATNVSVADFMGWQLAGTEIEFKIVSVDALNVPVVGSTEEKGIAIVKDVNPNAGDSGAEEFSVELEVDYTGYTFTAVV